MAAQRSYALWYIRAPVVVELRGTQSIILFYTNAFYYYYGVYFNITPKPKESRSRESQASSILYGYRKCVTRARVFS